MLLSVVIPVYNERETLTDLLDHVKAVPIRKGNILVDDCSKDGTRDVLKQLEDEQRERENAGGRKSDRNEPPDGDLSRKEPRQRARRADWPDGQRRHRADSGRGPRIRPVQYPRLLRLDRRGKADVVYGSRFSGDQPHRVLYYWHYLGNRFLTTLSRTASRTSTTTDAETCYKVFTRAVIDDISPRLEAGQFGIEPEITAKIAHRRYRAFTRCRSAIPVGRTIRAKGRSAGETVSKRLANCIVKYGLSD